MLWNWAVCAVNIKVGFAVANNGAIAVLKAEVKPNLLCMKVATWKVRRILILYNINNWKVLTTTSSNDANA